MSKKWHVVAVMMMGAVSSSAWSDVGSAPLNPGLVGSSALPRGSTSQSLEAYQVSELNGQRSGPGIAFGSQVGFGLGGGDAAFGVGGQNLSGSTGSTRYDGSASASVGLGDSRRIALETTLNVISLVGLGEDGSFSFKLHRLVAPLTSVSVGVEQVLRWGDARQESHSTYIAATHVLPLKTGSAITLNGGVGNGRYKDQDDAGGFFGGLAFIQNDRLSYILDYTGRDLNAAVSLVPLNRWPVSVTVGNVNVLENDKQRRSFAGSAGLLIKF